MRRISMPGKALGMIFAGLAGTLCLWAAASGGAPVWENDLTPIKASEWNYDRAAHLLERAGFGGTPDEIQQLAKLTPAQADARLVRFEGTHPNPLPPFH